MQTISSVQRRQPSTSASRAVHARTPSACTAFLARPERSRERAPGPRAEEDEERRAQADQVHPRGAQADLVAPSCHHSRLGESIPADVLAATSAGQILPPQLEERERVGWDEGVGEAVAQNAVIQNARAVKGRMSGMTEKELAELVQPRTTRSQTAAAAAAAPAECIKKDIEKAAQGQQQ